MEYKKNDRVTVTIEDMGSDGEGIGKVDGFTLFIKDAVIGDQVEAKIIKSKKHYAYARLEKVLQPSPFRVEMRLSQTVRWLSAAGTLLLRAAAFQGTEDPQQSDPDRWIRYGIH